jgi:hypothetical protein
VNLHLALNTAIAAAIGALLAFMLVAAYWRRRRAHRPAPNPTAAPAEPGPSGMGELQSLQLHNLEAIHGQGVVTALMDKARAPKPPSANPYPDGQPRAVWFAGYAMAQARADSATHTDKSPS